MFESDTRIDLRIALYNSDLFPIKVARHLISTNNLIIYSISTLAVYEIVSQSLRMTLARWLDPAGRMDFVKREIVSSMRYQAGVSSG